MLLITSCIRLQPSDLTMCVLTTGLSNDDFVGEPREALNPPVVEAFDTGVRDRSSWASFGGRKGDSNEGFT